MQGRVLLRCLCAGVLFVSGAGQASAKAPVYDAARQFSLSSNPNGVWTYLGFEMGGFRLLTATTQDYDRVAGWDAWTNARSVAKAEVIAVNQTGKPIHRFPFKTVHAGQLLMQPGMAPSVAVWFTVPTTGVYGIHAEFQSMNRQQRGSRVELRYNKVVRCSGQLATFTDVVTCNRRVTLNAGDKVEAITYDNINPNPNATGELTFVIHGPITPD